VKTKWIYYIAIAFVLAACAQVKTLPGGEKDTAAPKIVAAFPDTLSTHFSANSFEIEFDEFIQLNNVQQELVVSPPLKKAPVVKMKGRGIEVSWTDTLRPNTTYNFMFGEGIIDLNEGNKATNLSYVFSTGDQLDSLSFEGKVFDAWTSAPLKGARIVLFDNDSAVFSKHPKPISIGKVDDNGHFQLNYLHQGSYFLYAIDDLNANYAWDLKESVAFLDKAVVLPNTDTLGVALYTSNSAERKPFLPDYKVDSLGRLSIPMNLNLYPGLRIESLDPSLQLISTKSSNEDSLTSRIVGAANNAEIQLRVAIDSLVLDTIDVPFFQEAFTPAFKVSSVSERIKPKADFILKSPRLIDYAVVTQMQLKLDSVDVDFNVLVDDKTHDRIRVNAAWKAGKEYKMVLLPGALKDYNNQTNDTLNFTVKVSKPEDLGNLQLDMEFGEALPHYRMIVLNAKEEKVSEFSEVSAGKYNVEGLLPGDYFLKVYSDTNNNGKWDSGDFLTKRQPEKTFVLPQKVQVRANWDVNQKWKVN
jgi:hypothetical protein